MTFWLGRSEHLPAALQKIALTGYNPMADALSWESPVPFRMSHELHMGVLWLCRL